MCASSAKLWRRALGSRLKIRCAKPTAPQKRDGHKSRSTAFAVEGRSRVLAAFLCSHFDVGTAALYLLPQALAASSPASAATALGGAIASVRVDLHWSSSTSQQCIVDVGNSGEGAHLLIVVANHEDGHRVAGTPSSTSASPSPSSDLRRHGHESRQVLLYGVFTHALGYT